jgi:chromosome partitioning protein
MDATITHNGPIYVFANYKGGVAKTESTYRVGIQFARQGLLPWLIDLDPQANLTRRCGGIINGQKTISDVLGGAVPATAKLNQAAHRIELNQHSSQLVASSIMLENVAVGLLQRNFGRLTALSTAIHECSQFIGACPTLIDTPPNAGILTLNALVAATHLVICAEPEEDAIAGVKRIVDIVGQIKAERGVAPKIVGVIATRADEQLTRHQSGLVTLASLGLPVLGVVPKRAGVDADRHLDAAYKPIAEQIWRRGG